MTPRTCQNPACPATIDHMRANARYCSTRCKHEAWKDRTGYVVKGAQRGGKASQRRKGGMQVSYLRVFELLRGEVALHVLGSPVACEDADRWARSKLDPLLSDKQRARLDARDG